jgi:hypothetical protein
MAIKSSDIAVAFVGKNRVRTVNLRGSILETTIALNGSMFAANNDIIALMPIPYSASIKSIGIGTVNVMTSAVGNVGIYGINNDDPMNLTVIIADALRSNGSLAGTVNSWVKLIYPIVTDKTIYQLLCNDQGVPIDTFKPYIQNRYGMLAFTMTAAAAAAGNTDANIVKIIVRYIEGSPSEGPLTELTINSRATPIA